MNHTLFSNVATIASSLVLQKPHKHSAVLIRIARRAYNALLDCLEKFENSERKNLSHLPKEEDNKTEVTTPEDVMIKEQLEFIHKLTIDIKKTTEKIISS